MDGLPFEGAQRRGYKLTVCHSPQLSTGIFTRRRARHRHSYKYSRPSSLPQRLHEARHGGHRGLQLRDEALWLLLPIRPHRAARVQRLHYDVVQGLTCRRGQQQEGARTSRDEGRRGLCKLSLACVRAAGEGECISVSVGEGGYWPAWGQQERVHASEETRVRPPQKSNVSSPHHTHLLAGSASPR